MSKPDLPETEFLPFTADDFRDDRLIDVTQALAPHGSGVDAFDWPTASALPLGELDEPADSAGSVGRTTRGGRYEDMQAASDVETELQEIEACAETLLQDGLIADADVAEDANDADDVAGAGQARRMFHELPREQRQAIVRRRRDIGLHIMGRQAIATPVVSVPLQLNHARLRGLFEGWWPYLNRVELDLQRLGRLVFSKSEEATLHANLEDELTKLEAYVARELMLAKAFRNDGEARMVDAGEIVFRPTITRPAVDIEVEALSRFAVRALQVIRTYDKVMDEFDFMVWNGMRNMDEVSGEVSRFGRRFQPLGLHGYQIYLKLLAAARAR
ncbi:ATPase [Cupriavidus pauculus]|uniref:ATPase n=1 Tax=Cupriavidus pauculus TaxID=82633 RepID=UPI001EE26370|nr:ATPase [Cupriavidus pauculus]GJG97770.1 hypothetical protein CBA19C6_24795 [Cupriavidus pauculus]